MGRKVSFEEFVKRSNKVHHGKYSYHEESYTNTHDVTLITCPIHGDFGQTPKNHIKGQGCPKCGKEHATNYKKHKWENFVNESNKRFHGKYDFPNIEQEYENSHSKVTIHCKECGNVFGKIAGDHITSSDGGCLQCRRIMRKKFYTYKDVKPIADEKGIAIKLFEGKITKNDIVALICPIHGEYKAKLNAVLYGKGHCRKCHCGKPKRTMDSFKNEFETKYGDLIEANYATFTSMSKPMEYRCKICGNIFKRTPQAMIGAHYKHGPCPTCSQRERSRLKTKTTEEFKRQVEAKHGKYTFDLSKTTYAKSSSLVTLKCNECGRYFTIEANSLLQGHGCPYHNCNHSKAEDEIAEYIEQMGIKVLTNDRMALPSHKELDIHVPDHKIAIEYDGLFWHNEQNKGRDYHLGKTIECQENGIRLFHVFEDEWIEKQDVWKSILFNAFGKDGMVQSESYEIVDIDDQTAKSFFEKNSLFEFEDYGINLGIIDAHKTLIFAFCCDENTSAFIYAALPFWDVQKPLKWVLEHTKEHYQLEQPLNTLVDLRWGCGSELEALGFKKKEVIPPQFYYGLWSMRKSQKEFSLLTETEKNKKWFKIYDCGYEKYALDV